MMEERFVVLDDEEEHPCGFETRSSCRWSVDWGRQLRVIECSCGKHKRIQYLLPLGGMKLFPSEDEANALFDRLEAEFVRG